MKKNQKKAFTLVELIVVITILAILGTIAFISMQSYSKSARDSVRISDLSNIKKSLELFHIDAGKYPLTTGGYDVTYGSGNVWNQGTFGETTFKNVDTLDKISLDPLTEKEYTYSLLNTKQEYELAGIMESESLVLNNILGNEANAAEQTMSVMVTGNYNGEILNVTKSGTLCVVAVPSIITSSGTTLELIVPNNYFVYNNYTNLPSNYNTTTKFKLLGETDLKLVNESNMDLFCGDFSTLNTDETVRLDFIENFQKAYTGTQVDVTGRIREVLELTIDRTNPTPDLKIYTIELIENVFKATISDEQKLLAAECNTDYHFEGSICISNTKTITITNGVGIQTWNGTTRGSTVLSSCNIGFHTEDNITCINDIQGCTITNGTGTDTWDGSSWNCNVTTCDTDYYNSGDNTCSVVGNGYYSNSTDTTRTICTNNPDTTSRDYTYTSSGNGTDNCNATYTELCGLDLYETANGICTAVGIGYYSTLNSNTRTGCTNKPTNSIYSGEGNGTDNCTYTCDTNYSGANCIADTKATTCGGSIVTNATASAATTYTQTWNGSIWTPTTNWGESQATCDFNCNANYTWNGTSCVIVITDWRSKDPNCDKPDITIGSQTWAGCNSTLGTGFERGKKDDETNGAISSCYNYDLTNSIPNCSIGATSMASNTSAIIFFNAMQPDGTNANLDAEVNNIWGKLYTWANAPSACPTGRHLPSDANWEVLETTLNGGTNCRNATDGFLCDGLGWKSNVSYNPDRKLVETLKIPLAGNRYTDGVTFYDRGYLAYLWSSTSNSTNAYYRNLYQNFSSVNRYYRSQLYGYSVRCLKD